MKNRYDHKTNTNLTGGDKLLLVIGSIFASILASILVRNFMMLYTFQNAGVWTLTATQEVLVWPISIFLGIMLPAVSTSFKRAGISGSNRHSGDISRYDTD